MAIKTVCPECGKDFYSEHLEKYQTTICKVCNVHFEIPDDAEIIQTGDIPKEYILKHASKPWFMPTDAGVKPHIDIYGHDSTVLVIMGIVCFAGGAHGMSLLMRSLLGSGIIAGPIWIKALFFTLYSGCAATGVGLILRKDLALFWAKIFFLLQIPIYISDPFAYYFISGISFNGMITSIPSLGFELDYGGKFIVHFMGQAQYFVSGVNCLAWAGFLYLFNRNKQLQKRANIANSVHQTNPPESET